MRFFVVRITKFALHFANHNEFMFPSLFPTFISYIYVSTSYSKEICSYSAMLVRLVRKAAAAPVDRQVYSWQILIGKLRNSASERAADHKYLPYSQFQWTAKYFQGVDRLVTSFVVTSLDSGQRSYSMLAWLAAVNKISTSAETLLRMTEITEVHIRGHLISAN